MLHNEFSSSSAGCKLLREAPEEDKEIQEVTDKLAHADRVGGDDVVLFDQN